MSISKSLKGHEQTEENLEVEEGTNEDLKEKQERLGNYRNVIFVANVSTINKDLKMYHEFSDFPKWCLTSTCSAYSLCIKMIS